MVAVVMLCLLLVLFLLGNDAFVFESRTFSRHISKQRSSLQSTPRSEDLFKENVQYFDPVLRPQGLQTGDGKPTRSLPLFLLGGAFYPEGITYLRIFEMKYRTMMFDIAKQDDVFGYVHVNPSTGQIASIGTLCKVIDRQLLEDGGQLIALQGIDRFRINNIEKTLPYVVAEVNTGVEDVAEKGLSLEEAGKQLTQLEAETYSYLKYYLRLLKSYPSNAKMVVSQAIRRTRPLIRRPLTEFNPSFSTSFGTTISASAFQNNDDATPLALPPAKPYSLEDFQRQSKFSFALANMMQMTDVLESQLLLQTTSLKNRLQVECNVLSQACTYVSDDLKSYNLKDIIAIEALRAQSFNPYDDDDKDILPEEQGQEENEEEEDEWNVDTLE